MKNKISILLSVLFFSSCGGDLGYPWFLGNFNEAKDIAKEKLIMLDFYAAW